MEQRLTRKELEELDVIDFPVSEAYARHYRDAGYYIPAHQVRRDTRPQTSIPVDNETSMKMAALWAEVDTLKNQLAEAFAMQQEEVNRIKRYLNEQHKEKQTEKEQQDQLPHKPNYQPRGGI